MTESWLRTLYVLRHGHTEANEAGLFQGHRLYTPLTELGERQARTMGHILAKEIGRHATVSFVSSPLGRAQATMRIVRNVLGMNATDYAIDDRLVEIDHGDWVGKTEAQVKAVDSEFFMSRLKDKWNVRMPHGESYAELATRVQSFLDATLADTVVVTHGAVTQVLRGLCARIDPPRIPDLDEPQGVVFRVRGRKVKRLDSP